jgi:hypothetical protein
VSINDRVILAPMASFDFVLTACRVYGPCKTTSSVTTSLNRFSLLEGGLLEQE